MAKVVLTGVPELDRRMKSLGLKLGKKIVRKAARRAIKPVQSAAQRRAPKDTGALRKSIKIRAMKRSRSNFGVVVTTGASAGNAFSGDQFYGAFQEFGWKTGKRGSDNRTEVEGVHFMENAAEAKRRSVQRNFARFIKEGIESEAPRG